MFLKSSLIKLLLYLSLIILSYEQTCVQGQNCPYNQGVCVQDYCSCNKGYHTLVDQSLPVGQQIFCNYKKISQYTPIILEIFLPSFGHFAVGKYWMGLLKLSLLATFLVSSYLLYNDIKMPSLMSALLEKIGIEKFLGIGEDEKGGEDEKKEEEEGGEEDNLLEEEKKKKNTLRGREDAKQNSNKYKVKEQYHETEKKDDNETEQKEPFINKEDGEEKEEENPMLKFAFEITGVFFSLIYFLDLFMYKFNVYNDGFGVPFV